MRTLTVGSYALLIVDTRNITARQRRGNAYGDGRRRHPGCSGEFAVRQTEANGRNRHPDGARPGTGYGGAGGLAAVRCGLPGNGNDPVGSSMMVRRNVIPQPPVTFGVGRIGPGSSGADASWGSSLPKILLTAPLSGRVSPITSPSNCDQRHILGICPVHEVLTLRLRGGLPNSVENGARNPAATGARALLSDLQTGQLADDLNGERVQRRHTVPHGRPGTGDIDHQGAAGDAGQPRDSPASVMPADSPEARRASAMPSSSRSSRSTVASGVTSRGVTPVPPTDTTRSTPPMTAVFSALRISIRRRRPPRRRPRRTPPR